MCDIPDFQTKILDILAVAKGVKVPSNEKQGAFSKFVGNARYSRDKFISNFSTVKQQIGTMLAVISEHQTVLTTANNNLDIMYDNNIIEYENLTNYIKIGVEVVEFKKHELAALQEKLSDMLQAQRVSDMSALITRWEARVDNLRKFQMAAIQTAPTIRAMQTNNLLLGDKFTDLQTITIPSWEKQFALRINLQDQQKANKLANTIDDATNDFMLENSKLLCDTSVSVAQSNQRGSIYIETLEGVQQNLVNMFDEIKQINTDGEIARKDAFNRMEQMKTVYLQIAKNELN
jgi:uncharacterized protein YaaN involved in tellurite resistance